MFASKLFWNNLPEDIYAELNSYKLPESYTKPIPSIKDYFYKESQIIEETPNIDLASTNIEKISKQFCNLRLLFRNHYMISPNELPDILEIFSFFSYFYDLIDGPDFEIEELYLCLKQNKFSDLTHDIFISLIIIYLKEFLVKEKISFEQENGQFFFLLQFIGLKESHKNLLVKNFWIDFLKEILIRKLLEEESIEEEVDELLVEVQKLHLEEEEEEEEGEGDGDQDDNHEKENVDDTNNQDNTEKQNDNKIIEEEEGEEKPKPQPITEEQSNNSINEKTKPSTTNPKNLEKDTRALNILEIYKTVKNTNVNNFDELPYQEKVKILLFLIDDCLNLGTFREFVNKKTEELTQKINLKQKKISEIKEAEIQIKEINTKMEEVSKQIEEKEKQENSQKEVNLLKTEKNKISRSIGKIETDILKLSQSLRDLNTSIPFCLFPKKILGTDPFGNELIYFSFDCERLYLLSSDLQSCKVFTGSFEVIKDFLNENGIEQKSIMEKLTKIVQINILDQSSSQLISEKIFNEHHYSIYNGYQNESEEDLLSDWYMRVKPSAPDQEYINKKTKKYTEMVKDYNSMFEKQFLSSDRKQNSENKLLNEFYQFFTNCPQTQRINCLFLQQLVCFIEEYYSEYLKLLDSYWMDEDEIETNFFEKLNGCDTIPKFKEILQMINNGFLTRYYKVEIESQEFEESQPRPMLRSKKVYNNEDSDDSESEKIGNRRRQRKKIDLDSLIEEEKPVEESNFEIKSTKVGLFSYHTYKFKKCWNKYLIRAESWEELLFLIYIYGLNVFYFISNKLEKMEKKNQIEKSKNNCLGYCKKEQEKMKKRLRQLKNKSSDEKEFRHRYKFRNSIRNWGKPKDICSVCEYDFKIDDSDYKVKCISCEKCFHSSCVSNDELKDTDVQNWRCNECVQKISTRRFTRNFKKKMNLDFF